MGSFAILVGILYYFYFIATLVFKFIIFLLGEYSSLKLPHGFLHEKGAPKNFPV